MSSFCMARVRIEKNNPGEIELKKDAHAERERERERESERRRKTNLQDLQDTKPR